MSFSNPTLTFTPTIAILVNSHATQAKPFYTTTHISKKVDFNLKSSDPILSFDCENHFQVWCNCKALHCLATNNQEWSDIKNNGYCLIVRSSVMESI